MKLHDVITRLRAGKKNDEGFTLIELLVVVVIIGVLVAIAVPVYLNYRQGADDKSAQSDVRGAISAIEQFYTENGNKYPDDKTGAEGESVVLAAPGGTEQTITVSPGNTLGFNNSSTGTAASYTICAQNGDGKQVYVYNSTTGGSVKKSTQTSIADCLTSGT